MKYYYIITFINNIPYRRLYYKTRNKLFKNNPSMEFVNLSFWKYLNGILFDKKRIKYMNFTLRKREIRDKNKKLSKFFLK